MERDYELDQDCDEEHAMVFYSYWSAVIWWYSRRKDIVERNRITHSDERLAMYFHRIIGYGGDVRFIDMFRMEKAHFFNLCMILRTRQLLKDTEHVLVEEQVALFLYILAHNQRNRMIETSFARSGQSVKRYFRQVLQAIGSLKSEYINGPSLDHQPKIMDSSENWPYFKVSLSNYI